MDPNFFPSPAAFRKWLEKNHTREKEVLVGFYKVSTGKPSMTWSESVDEALCFGWIDGIRRSLGEESYTIRFTPRKPKSIWSAVNLAKVDELIKNGKMQAAGLAVYQNRDLTKAGLYSFEQAEIKLEKEFEKIFRKNAKAWKNFHAMPPSYRKPAMHWVMSAKQEITRMKRLETLIADSEQNLRVKPLRRN